MSSTECAFLVEPLRSKGSQTIGGGLIALGWNASVHSRNNPCDQIRFSDGANQRIVGDHGGQGNLVANQSSSPKISMAKKSWQSSMVAVVAGSSKEVDATRWSKERSLEKFQCLHNFA
jgi:hypothetical protein